MKLLFASDSFKRTLSSEQTGKLLADAAREVFGECETETVPAADGGEGTTRAVVKARGGELERVFVNGPYMEAEPAIFGKIGTEEAVMEMASASGLPMVPEEKRDPRYGVYRYV
ncbi:glycerate kinase [[Clostridium] aminophilum]|uniref:glycerate kinase n=1 Tax=[Clostridium] aminophilum TaxID=1526 RepID=UPI003F97D8C1